jgi:hypothetical protein
MPPGVLRYPPVFRTLRPSRSHRTPALLWCLPHFRVGSHPECVFPILFAPFFRSYPFVVLALHVSVRIGPRYLPVTLVFYGVFRRMCRFLTEMGAFLFHLYWLCAVHPVQRVTVSPLLTLCPIYFCLSVMLRCHLTGPL